MFDNSKKKEIKDKELGNLLSAKFDTEFDITYDNSDTSVSLSHIVSIAFIWVQGLRANSNIIWVPEEKNLYYKNIYNKEYEAWAYHTHVFKIAVYPCISFLQLFIYIYLFNTAKNWLNMCREKEYHHIMVVSLKT